MGGRKGQRRARRAWPVCHAFSQICRSQCSPLLGISDDERCTQRCNGCTAAQSKRQAARIRQLWEKVTGCCFGAGGSHP